MTLGFSCMPTSTVPHGPYVGNFPACCRPAFQMAGRRSSWVSQQIFPMKNPLQCSLSSKFFDHLLLLSSCYSSFSPFPTNYWEQFGTVCIQRYARNQLVISSCLHDQPLLPSESWCHSILATAECYLSVIYSFLLVRNQWKLQFAFLTDVFRCQEVDQRGHGEMLCKKLVKHIIWTGRMLWIVADGRSW